MESELFKWDAWDIQDTAAFTFYDVVLKRDIGPHKVGDKFATANIDYENGTLSFARQKPDLSYESAGTYRISLQVGEEIADKVGS